MNGDGITRRKFMARSAAVGLGVLAHLTFSAKVFGANERLVIGIIGAGGMGRGHMENFKNLGAEWGAVCDVYAVNLDAGLEPITYIQLARQLDGSLGEVASDLLVEVEP